MRIFLIANPDVPKSFEKRVIRYQKGFRMLKIALQIKYLKDEMFIKDRVYSDDRLLS